MARPSRRATYRRAGEPQPAVHRQSLRDQSARQRELVPSPPRPRVGDLRRRETSCEMESSPHCPATNEPRRSEGMIDDNEPATTSAGESRGLRSTRHDDVPPLPRGSRETQFLGDRTSSPSRRRDPALAVHRAAVANTLTWAEECAARGDYVDALAWLNVLDAIRETIPEEYEIKRLDWRRALIDQHMPQCTA